MTSRIVRFLVGDREVEVMVQPMATLQAVLRYQLGLTAAKEGCRQGGCGSCTVLVDDEPVLSCLLPVEAVEGRRVATLETIGRPDAVHPVQQAFLDGLAFQCGYCTPGMVMVSTALLGRNPAPSRGEIIDALSGNVCRCTGYEPIIGAVESAARVIASKEAEPR
jgi:aerobic carbon-monoxide dehydrogenase small subunit